MKTKLNLAVNEESQRAFDHARLFLGVLADLGHTLDGSASILDLGCGEGWMVYAFRKLGYKAFGTDIISVSSAVHTLMQREGLCRSGEQLFSTVNPSDCRIPVRRQFLRSGRLLRCDGTYKELSSGLR